MIRIFRSMALRRFMEHGDERRIAPEHRATGRGILAHLNAPPPGIDSPRSPIVPDLEIPLRVTAGRFGDAARRTREPAPA